MMIRETTHGWIIVYQREGSYYSPLSKRLQRLTGCHTAMARNSQRNPLAELYRPIKIEVVHTEGYEKNGGIEMIYDVTSIIDAVNRGYGLMGMKVKGYVDEMMEVSAGMIKVFYHEKKQGRKVVKGQRAFIVCSTQIVDKVLKYNPTNRIDLSNGLTLIIE